MIKTSKKEEKGEDRMFLSTIIGTGKLTTLPGKLIETTETITNSEPSKLNEETEKKTMLKLSDDGKIIEEISTYSTTEYFTSFMGIEIPDTASQSTICDLCDFETSSTTEASTDEIVASTKITNIEMGNQKSSLSRKSIESTNPEYGNKELKAFITNFSSTESTTEYSSGTEIENSDVFSETSGTTVYVSKYFSVTIYEDDTKVSKDLIVTSSLSKSNVNESSSNVANSNKSSETTTKKVINKVNGERAGISTKSNKKFIETAISENENEKATKAPTFINKQSGKISTPEDRNTESKDYIKVDTTIALPQNNKAEIKKTTAELLEIETTIVEAKTTEMHYKDKNKNKENTDNTAMTEKKYENVEKENEKNAETTTKELDVYEHIDEETITEIKNAIKISEEMQTSETKQEEEKYETEEIMVEEAEIGKTIIENKMKGTIAKKETEETTIDKKKEPTILNGIGSENITYMKEQKTSQMAENTSKRKQTTETEEVDVDKYISESEKTATEIKSTIKSSEKVQSSETKEEQGDKETKEIAVEKGTETNTTKKEPEETMIGKEKVGIEFEKTTRSTYTEEEETSENTTEDTQTKESEVIDVDEYTPITEGRITKIKSTIESFEKEISEITEKKDEETEKNMIKLEEETSITEKKKEEAIVETEIFSEKTIISRFTKEQQTFEMEENTSDKIQITEFEKMDVDKYTSEADKTIAETKSTIRGSEKGQISETKGYQVDVETEDGVVTKKTGKTTGEKKSEGSTVEKDKVEIGSQKTTISMYTKEQQTSEMVEKTKEAKHTKENEVMYVDEYTSTAEGKITKTESHIKTFEKGISETKEQEEETKNTTIKQETEKTMLEKETEKTIVETEKANIGSEKTTRNTYTEKQQSSEVVENTTEERQTKELKEMDVAEYTSIADGRITKIKSTFESSEKGISNFKIEENTKENKREKERGKIDVNKYNLEAEGTNTKIKSTTKSFKKGQTLESKEEQGGGKETIDKTNVENGTEEIMIDKYSLLEKKTEKSKVEREKEETTLEKVRFGKLTTKSYGIEQQMTNMEQNTTDEKQTIETEEIYVDKYNFESQKIFTKIYSTIKSSENGQNLEINEERGNKETKGTISEIETAKTLPEEKTEKSIVEKEKKETTIKKTESEILTSTYTNEEQTFKIIVNTTQGKQTTETQEMDVEKHTSEAEKMTTQIKSSENRQTLERTKEQENEKTKVTMIENTSKAEKIIPENKNIIKSSRNWQTLETEGEQEDEKIKEALLEIGTENIMAQRKTEATIAGKENQETIFKEIGSEKAMRITHMKKQQTSELVNNAIEEKQTKESEEMDLDEYISTSEGTAIETQNPTENLKALEPKEQEGKETEETVIKKETEKFMQGKQTEKSVIEKAIEETTLEKIGSKITTGNRADGKQIKEITAIAETLNTGQENLNKTDLFPGENTLGLKDLQNLNEGGKLLLTEIMPVEIVDNLKAHPTTQSTNLTQYIKGATRDNIHMYNEYSEEKYPKFPGLEGHEETVYNTKNIGQKKGQISNIPEVTTSLVQKEYDIYKRIYEITEGNNSTQRSKDGGTIKHTKTLKKEESKDTSKIFISNSRDYGQQEENTELFEENIVSHEPSREEQSSNIREGSKNLEHIERYKTSPKTTGPEKLGSKIIIEYTVTPQEEEESKMASHLSDNIFFTEYGGEEENTEILRENIESREPSKEKQISNTPKRANTPEIAEYDIGRESYETSEKTINPETLQQKTILEYMITSQVEESNSHVSQNNFVTEYIEEEIPSEISKENIDTQGPSIEEQASNTSKRDKTLSEMEYDIDAENYEKTKKTTIPETLEQEPLLEYTMTSQEEETTEISKENIESQEPSTEKQMSNTIEGDKNLSQTEYDIGTDRYEITETTTSPEKLKQETNLEHTITFQEEESKMASEISNNTFVTKYHVEEKKAEILKEKIESQEPGIVNQTPNASEGSKNFAQSEYDRDTERYEISTRETSPEILKEESVLNYTIALEEKENKITSNVSEYTFVTEISKEEKTEMSEESINSQKLIIKEQTSYTSDVSESLAQTEYDINAESYETKNDKNNETTKENISQAEYKIFKTIYETTKVGKSTGTTKERRILKNNKTLQKDELADTSKISKLTLNAEYSEEEKTTEMLKENIKSLQHLAKEQSSNTPKVSTSLEQRESYKTREEGKSPEVPKVKTILKHTNTLLEKESKNISQISRGTSITEYGKEDETSEMSEKTKSKTRPVLSTFEVSESLKQKEYEINTESYEGSEKKQSTKTPAVGITLKLDITLQREQPRNTYHISKNIDITEYDKEQDATEKSEKNIESQQSLTEEQTSNTSKVSKSPPKTEYDIDTESYKTSYLINNTDIPAVGTILKYTITLRETVSKKTSEIFKSTTGYDEGKEATRLSKINIKSKQPLTKLQTSNTLEVSDSFAKQEYDTNTDDYEIKAEEKSTEIPAEEASILRYTITNVETKEPSTNASKLSDILSQTKYNMYEDIYQETTENKHTNIITGCTEFKHIITEDSEDTSKIFKSTIITNVTSQKNLTKQQISNTSEVFESFVPTKYDTDIFIVNNVSTTEKFGYTDIVSKDLATTIDKTAKESALLAFSFVNVTLGEEDLEKIIEGVKLTSLREKMPAESSMYISQSFNIKGTHQTDYQKGAPLRHFQTKCNTVILPDEIEESTEIIMSFNWDYTDNNERYKSKEIIETVQTSTSRNIDTSATETITENEKMTEYYEIHKTTKAITSISKGYEETLLAGDKTEKESVKTEDVTESNKANTTEERTSKESKGTTSGNGEAKTSMSEEDQETTLAQGRTEEETERNEVVTESDEQGDANKGTSKESEEGSTENVGEAISTTQETEENSKKETQEETTESSAVASSIIPNSIEIPDIASQPTACEHCDSENSSTLESNTKVSSETTALESDSGMSNAISEELSTTENASERFSETMVNKGEGKESVTTFSEFSEFTTVEIDNKESTVPDEKPSIETSFANEESDNTSALESRKENDITTLPPGKASIRTISSNEVSDKNTSLENEGNKQSITESASQHFSETTTTEVGSKETQTESNEFNENTALETDSRETDETASLMRSNGESSSSEEEPSESTTPGNDEDKLSTLRTSDEHFIKTINNDGSKETIAASEKSNETNSPEFYNKESDEKENLSLEGASVENNFSGGESGETRTLESNMETDKVTLPLENADRETISFNEVSDKTSTLENESRKESITDNPRQHFSENVISEDSTTQTKTKGNSSRETDKPPSLMGSSEDFSLSEEEPSESTTLKNDEDKLSTTKTDENKDSSKETTTASEKYNESNSLEFSNEETEQTMPLFEKETSFSNEELDKTSIEISNKETTLPFQEAGIETSFSNDKSEKTSTLESNKETDKATLPRQKVGTETSSFNEVSDKTILLDNESKTQTITESANQHFNETTITEATKIGSNKFSENTTLETDKKETYEAVTFESTSEEASQQQSSETTTLEIDEEKLSTTRTLSGYFIKTTINEGGIKETITVGEELDGTDNIKFDNKETDVTFPFKGVSEQYSPSEKRSSEITNSVPVTEPSSPGNGSINFKPQKNQSGKNQIEEKFQHIKYTQVSTQNLNLTTLTKIDLDLIDFESTPCEYCNSESIFSPNKIAKTQYGEVQATKLEHISSFSISERTTVELKISTEIPENEETKKIESSAKIKPVAETATTQIPKEGETTKEEFSHVTANIKSEVEEIAEKTEMTISEKETDISTPKINSIKSEETILETENTTEGHSIEQTFKTENKEEKEALEEDNKNEENERKTTNEGKEIASEQLTSTEIAAGVVGFESTPCEYCKSKTDGKNVSYSTKVQAKTEKSEEGKGVEEEEKGKFIGEHGKEEDKNERGEGVESQKKKGGNILKDKEEVEKEKNDKQKAEKKVVENEGKVKEGEEKEAEENEEEEKEGEDKKGKKEEEEGKEGEEMDSLHTTEVQSNAEKSEDKKEGEKTVEEEKEKDKGNHGKHEEEEEMEEGEEEGEDNEEEEEREEEEEKGKEETKEDEERKGKGEVGKEREEGEEREEKEGEKVGNVKKQEEDEKNKQKGGKKVEEKEGEENDKEKAKKGEEETEDTEKQGNGEMEEKNETDQTTFEKQTKEITVGNRTSEIEEEEEKINENMSQTKNSEVINTDKTRENGTNFARLIGSTKGVEEEEESIGNILTKNYSSIQYETHKPVVIVINNSGSKLNKLNETLLEGIIDAPIQDVNIQYIDIETNENESSPLMSKNKSLILSIPYESCKMADYVKGQNCLCDIQSYINTLLKKVNKKEVIKFKENYCKNFIILKSGLLIENSVKPVERKRRSLAFLENLKHKEENVEYATIDGLFESEYKLNISDTNLFCLPGETLKIHCTTRNDLRHDEKETVWTFRPLSSSEDKQLMEKGNELVIHGASIKNTGNYTCSMEDEENIPEKRHWHELEMITFPIYDINMNIFYKINDSCSLRTGDILYSYLPKIIGPLLCANDNEVCSIDLQRPRCLTRADDNYFNVTMKTKIEPDFLSSLHGTCDINCKLRAYENLINVVYKNIEILEGIPVYSKIEPSHTIEFLPNINGKEGSPVSFKPPKIMVFCPGGFGLESQRRSVCVSCPSHTFSGDHTAFCITCPAGQYQPDPGSKSCLQCNSPVDHEMCLRMLYTDTKLFKIYVGVAFGLIVLMVIIIIVWSSGYKDNAEVRRSYYEGSLRHRATTKRRDPDIETGVKEPLLGRSPRKQTPPQLPPVDF